MGAPRFYPNSRRLVYSIIHDERFKPNASHRVTLSRSFQPPACDRAGPTADAAAGTHFLLVHP